MDEACRQINTFTVITHIPYGLVARIPGFHPGGSGSIPGMGNIFLFVTFII